MQANLLVFRKILLSLSLLLVLVVVAGCGGRGTETSIETSMLRSGAAATPAAESPLMQAAANAASGTSAESTALFVGPAGATGSVGPSGTYQSSVTDGRKIVANAHMELLVRNPQQLSDAIAGLMKQTGGYVSAANLQSKGEQRNVSEEGSEMYVGMMTLRIPTAQLEESMVGLERLAIEVKSKSIDRQDVTDQFTDIDAQLRNLNATETELLALLTEVRKKPNATPESILAVHDRVTQIRLQIEQLQGRKNMLDNWVSLSTINLSILQWLPPQPKVEIQVVEEPVWQPWQVAIDAKEALTVRMQQLTDRAIWLLVYRLPILLLYLIPLSILALFVRWLWRRVNLPVVVPVSR